MIFRDRIYSAEQDAWTSIDLRKASIVTVCVRPMSDGAWPTDAQVKIETTLDGFEWQVASWIDERTGTETSATAFTARGTKRIVTGANSIRCRARVSTISSAAHDSIEVTFASDAFVAQVANFGTGLSAGATVGGSGGGAPNQGGGGIPASS